MLNFSQVVEPTTRKYEQESDPKTDINMSQIWHEQLISNSPQQAGTGDIVTRQWS